MRQGSGNGDRNLNWRNACGVQTNRRRYIAVDADKTLHFHVREAVLQGHQSAPYKYSHALILFLWLFILFELYVGHCGYICYIKFIM